MLYNVAGFLSLLEFEANGDIVEFYVSGVWKKVTNITENVKNIEDWIVWINAQTQAVIGVYAQFYGTKTLEYIQFVTEGDVTKVRFLNEGIANALGFAYNVELSSDGSMIAYPFSRQATGWGDTRLIVQGSFQTRYSVLAECDLVESPYKKNTVYVVGYGAISDYSKRKDVRMWLAKSVYTHETRKLDITNFKERNCKGIHQLVASFNITKLEGLTIQVEFGKGQDLRTTQKNMQLGDFVCGVLEVL